MLALALLHLTVNNTKQLLYSIGQLISKFWQFTRIKHYSHQFLQHQLVCDVEFFFGQLSRWKHM